MDVFDFFGNGVKQGALISCSIFSVEFREYLSNSRALIISREAPVSERDYILVISQDCDINNHNVENIELILIRDARSKDKKNKNYRKGRNFKTLVIPEGDFAYILNIDLISNILKSCLIEQLRSIDMENIKQLSTKNIDIVLQWLTSKLVRKPFPDGFNKIFLPIIWNDDLGFGSFLEENHNNINEVYAYVDPKDDDSDSYSVIIVALLTDRCDSVTAGLIKDKLYLLLNELNKSESLNILQLEEGAAYRVVENISVIQYPSEFMKSDELMMNPVTLNYLCWPDD